MLWVAVLCYRVLVQHVTSGIDAKHGSSTYLYLEFMAPARIWRIENEIGIARGIQNIDAAMRKNLLVAATELDRAYGGDVA